MNINLALDSTQASYVNYHNSVEDMATITACGELDR